MEIISIHVKSLDIITKQNFDFEIKTHSLDLLNLEEMKKFDDHVLNIVELLQIAILRDTVNKIKNGV